MVGMTMAMAMEDQYGVGEQEEQEQEVENNSTCCLEHTNQSNGGCIANLVSIGRPLEQEGRMP